MIEKVLNKIKWWIFQMYTRNVPRKVYPNELLKSHRCNSQDGQDYFVYYEYFSGRNQSGWFAEIGANDGITFSNCYLLETKGWTGLAVEPLINKFEILKKTRSCVAICGAIGNPEGKGATLEFLRISEVPFHVEMLSGLIDCYNKDHAVRIVNEVARHNGRLTLEKVPIYNLSVALNENSIPRVDYLSVDTEGGELEILKSIEFDKIDIELLSVEINYPDYRFYSYLKGMGYQACAIIGADHFFSKKR